MNNNAPILITGCPRSGTSMVAGIFNLCDAYLGHVDKMNENIPIRENLVKTYLQKIGMDVDGCFPLLSKYPIGYPEHWQELVLQTINKQSEENQKWVYKDCRSALLWHLWMLAFPDAVWIIVRRNKNFILNSCEKTGYMKTFNDEKIQQQVGVSTIRAGWKWMIDEYINRFARISTSCKNVFEIWPEKILDNDYSEIIKVVEFCGLHWNEEEVKNYIEPKIFRR